METTDTIPPWNAQQLQIEKERIPQGITSAKRWVIPYDGVLPVLMDVDVVCADNQRSMQTYGVLRHEPRRTLTHGNASWGQLYFAVTYPRLGAPDLTPQSIHEDILRHQIPLDHESLHQRNDDHELIEIYRQPSEDNYRHVAIKRLNRPLVDWAVKHGYEENPYCEIYRMRTLGDNIHLLRYIEVLINDEYLYIIMPRCQSLLQEAPMNEQRGREVLEHIIQDLEYLRRHHICHRDVSPDNFMIYNGRVLFIDPAMSIDLMDRDDHMIYNDGHQGCGKPAFWSPDIELLTQSHLTCYNGDSRDIWAACLVLYCYLTSTVLYDRPTQNDLHFRFFIIAKGLSVNLNEHAHAVQELTHIHNHEPADVQMKIIRKLRAIMDLTESRRNMLEHSLHFFPNKRWTLQEVKHFENSLR